LTALKHVTIAFTTATEGKNVQSVLDLVNEIYKQATTKISTGRINKAFDKIQSERSGAAKQGGKLPRIYYATQIAVNPITILMFVNDPGLFDENYRRYIVGRLQMLLPISEVPIRLLARQRIRQKKQNL
jgi:GTP-binding protein